ncbi:MAG: lysostaphin resistance A-like protein [Candidatus Cryptobacteroides sp.]
MKNTACNIPLWKWILELVLGFFLFLILYDLAQGSILIPSLPLKIVVIVLASFAILTLFLLWTKLFEKSWRFELLTESVFRNSGIGIVTGVLFFGFFTGILALSGLYGAQYASPDWNYIILNLFLYFLVACGEEVVFRGIVFRMIDERFGMWWALGISALLFGFIHIFQANASLWSSIAIAIEAGILLGAAFKYSGSLWLPIGIHWTWNFTQGNVCGFPVSGISDGESIFTAIVSGPELITGGAFGPEASIISVILGTLLSVMFIWLTKRPMNVK